MVALDPFGYIFWKLSNKLDLQISGICQPSFQAQRSSRGPDVGFGRVWLVNCPSQQGARTPGQITFFIPGFNTAVASLELWEGEGLKPREWRLHPQIVSQKFYNNRNSANLTWICSLKMTQCPVWLSPRALLSSDALAHD